MAFMVPEELLVEVISRLPLKSAARFMCVSKRWKYLISNATFVTSRTKALVLTQSMRERFSFHSVNHDASVESALNFPVQENLMRYRTVVAHCSYDGLLLIQIDSDLYVWNPLTGFFRKVFSFRLCLDRDPERDYFVGLCYDATANRYKVVLSTTIRTLSWREEHIYVGTCGESSLKSLSCGVRGVNPGPVFKGYIHWYWELVGDCDQFLSPHYIAYFDPGADDFVDVPMPHRKNGEGNVMLGLGVYDGCLCLTRWDEPGNHDGKIEFLAMKEYGNGDSWATMFVIPYMGPDAIPLFVTKCGKALFHMLNSRYRYKYFREIKGYDATDDSLIDISFPTEHGYFDVVVYEESWLSPTGHNWSEFDPKLLSHQVL